MEQTTVATPGVVPVESPSTVLNPDTVPEMGAGRPDLTPDKPETPKSIEDVLAEESKRLKGEDDGGAREKAEKAAESAKAKADEAKDAEKAEKAAKPEKQERSRGEDGKFAKAETEQPGQADKRAAEKPATGQDGEKPRQSEGRGHSEPPARFLPEARQKWANVPNEVKAEIHRVSQEMEAEITKHRDASERYEAIRQFDEVARSNGRELKDSLAKVVQVEQALARNPIAGLDMILREIGPRKPDGSPLSLYEIANYIVQQGPQAYQQNIAQARMQAQPQAQVPPPVMGEIERLRAEFQALRAEQTAVPIIQRFAEQHEDYYALEPQIAEILNSGVIEKIYGTGLSPEARLAEAYRMAGGTVSPSRSDPEPNSAHSEADTARPVNPDAGKKSVRGAPDDGHDPAVDETETDLREMLRKEMRKLTA